MNTLDRQWAALGRMMENPAILEKPGLTFNEICRLGGLDPDEMNRKSIKELGCCGRWLLDELRWINYICKDGKDDHSCAISGVRKD